SEKALTWVRYRPAAGGIALFGLKMAFFAYLGRSAPRRGEAEAAPAARSVDGLIPPISRGSSHVYGSQETRDPRRRWAGARDQQRDQRRDDPGHPGRRRGGR